MSLEEEGESIVKEVWGRTVAEHDCFKLVQNKLKRCRGALMRWSSQNKQETEKEVDFLTNRIKREHDHKGPHNATCIKTLQERLADCSSNKTWNGNKEKKKKNWYQLRDKNTKFVHVCASQIRKKNWIEKITNSQGRTMTDQQEIERAL